MRRVDVGGTWLDRSRVVPFRFDGAELVGFDGDTLASALLAYGTRAGFMSPISGRRRGVMTDGPEEPNAFIEIVAPYADLIAAATTVPVIRGLEARPRSGVADLAHGGRSDGAARRHRYRHVETLVVGGGEAGVAAARHAAIDGGRVLLADERHRLDEVAAIEGVDVRTNATVLGVYDDGFAVIHERRQVDHDATVWNGNGYRRNPGATVRRTWVEETLWHVRAGRVILATGAVERTLAFVGNDLPGVMLAGAVRRYAERYGILAGTRAVAFVTNDDGRDAALAARVAGIEVAEVVDVRDGARVIAAEGDAAVEHVLIRDPDGAERRVDADLILVSGGWNPNLALWRAIGGGLRYDEVKAAFVPDGRGPSWLEVVGAAAGKIAAAAPVWAVAEGEDASKYVDLQRDQTVADVRAAVDAGLRSVEHVKRATYIGTAVDQGRTSGVVTAEIVNALLGEGPGSQGPSNARPPTTPVSYATVAGPYRGELLDPVRNTPMHAWHVEHGAVFEDVGQWKRPRFFPRDGEDLDAAVARECLAVRERAGLLDASTLGKIEVVGPDAGTFLDRMYTNRMSNLAVGSIRYGLMLGLDGMVLDDGVAMRLADDRFLVTTTTSGAAAVLDRFEEWLQTEWPDLRVWCTSVTEQWAVASVGGPDARAVLIAAGTDLDLTVDGFPHMTFREGTVAGVPARVARVSFTGEVSFEVHVESWYGAHVWEAIVAAGAPHGLTPYGTEAMHLLRAEKGFVIVGQDTDGTVTPHDLGMVWIVNHAKGDFVGRRSLARVDTIRPDRKHLVGVLPLDLEERLPEGAQLVARDTGAVPMRMEGHVTSSYRSPSLGRTFALAMLERGHERHGERVFAPLGDRTIEAEVTAPVFYDVEGERRDG